MKGVSYSPFHYDIAMEYMEFDMGKVIDVGELAISTKCHTIADVLSLTRTLEITTSMADSGLMNQMALGCAKGLQFVHSQNISHRDLKPSNVLVRNCSSNMIQSKLCDFGEARSEMTKTRTVITTNKQRRGTLFFNGPEQFATVKSPSDIESLKQSDIWSLGMVLFCLANPSQAIPWMEDIKEAENYAVALRQVMLDFHLPTTNPDDALVASLGGLRQEYRQCLIYEPRDRPTAKAVTEQLSK